MSLERITTTIHFQAVEQEAPLKTISDIRSIDGYWAQGRQQENFTVHVCSLKIKSCSFTRVKWSLTPPWPRADDSRDHSADRYRDT